MTTFQAKFQQLLRELFQFDMADLDFGIYRIMNYKRQVIEHFITEDLPKLIAEEIDRDTLAMQTRAYEHLKEVREEVVKAFGPAALDDEGNLLEFRNTPLGEKYLKAQEMATPYTRSRQALEADIYNHLYTFFSRYYQDGDFISRRRYARKSRYAIPYNGEEVYLYWANHDQYYVKSGEHFRDYVWKTPNGVRVHFKLKAADVEQNDVKGAKRFFLPDLEGMVWEAEARRLTIPFEYRPLTKEEVERYGTRNQQEAILAELEEAVPVRLKDKPEALAALLAVRRQDAQGEPVSNLAHHLRRYTARHTRDFFIHKDLRGFLSRELDFYIKNEVLNLETMEAAGEEMSDGWFQLMRLIKRLGRQIIDFLAQIEEFQKALWEKRKFVTETFYLITVGHIPEVFYPEIAANEDQWTAWRDRLRLDSLAPDLFSGGLKGEEERLAFLRAHPTLMVDTRHFPTDFTDRLLAAFDDLDGMTDGLLVHSENWQALNTLLEKYRERVKCIHIDPPYNTQTNGFLYKNGYRHSSWLAMIENRVLMAMLFLDRQDGALLIHIDENEIERLPLALEQLGLPNSGIVIWDKRNPILGTKGIATQHEYICWRSFREKPIYRRNRNIRIILAKAREIVEKYGGVTSEAQRDFSQWIQRYPGLSGGERAYHFLDEEGRVYQSASLEAPEKRTNPKFFKPLIHPKTGKPCPVPSNGWSRTPETLAQLLTRGEILFGPDETVLPRRKVFLTEVSRRQLSSVLSDSKRGKQDANALGITFPYSHPVSLYEELIGAAADGKNDLVLDYFAGSGTTGHAVINLNREDGGRRKFILVEMADYFDDVLLPRIEKVAFTPAWKEGKPKRRATQEEFERGPRLIKVIRLESYEDALDNIAFDEKAGQQARAAWGQEYLLHYMLKWESRKSKTLLDVEALQRPFAYKLCLYREGESREQVVDLPETFNYLLGLEVERRQVYEDEGRRYLVYRGTTREGRRVAVIWRETAGWGKVDYERDAAFITGQGLAEGAEEVFVNGDAYLPNARSLDGLFKARMFGQAEV